MGEIDTKPIKISVITATYNVEKTLPSLINSLRNQTEKSFEWIVADGKSTDQTLKILDAVDDLDLKITSQSDFGIYDALNRGIKLARGEYYLVIGADDILFENAISDFMTELKQDNFDMVSARLLVDGRATGARRGPKIITRQFAFVSSHAVSTVFRKALHKDHGYYSNRFPIAADELFILTAANNGAKISLIESIVGEFSSDGISNNDVIGAITEGFRIQLNFNNKFITLIIFFLRVLKNIKRIR